MKNKIIMFALLCALLVGVVPLHHAEKAYAATELSPEFETAIKLLFESKDTNELLSTKHYVVGLNQDGGLLSVSFYDKSSAVCLHADTLNQPRVFCSNMRDSLSQVEGVQYVFDNGAWIYSKSGNVPIWGTRELGLPDIYFSSFSDMYDYNGNLVRSDIPDLLEYLEGYTFVKWCSDASLNCSPSSYENSLVVPYVYSDYIHLVRRTGLDKYGRWVLTTIGNSIIGDNLSDYTLMVDDNGELQVYALYSGEEEQGYQLFVRNYVYDTDGWKMISFELFDTREDDDFIIELGEDSAINDVNLLAYTNVDIYDDGLSLLHPASTEYYDVNDILPDVPEEPIVTPTVVPLPTVIPPISAGQATVTKNRTAIYEEPSSTSQVQHYLFEGGVVYVVEEYGEDWYYVRYDMGGLSYTGYVVQDNVNYDVDNGFASEDVIDGYEGQVDDLLGMVGNVPKMIYALFSFLPPWCLALVGVSFTAMLALIGWKVLRG